MINIFEQAETAGIIARINQLAPGTKPQWGKMTVAQMLAHCNVSYEMVYDDIHPEPGALNEIHFENIGEK